MYKINLLCDNIIIKDKFLHNIANIFTRIGVNSVPDDMHIVNYDTKKFLCETLINYLTGKNASNVQIRKILDHSQLTNYDEVIAGNYIDIASTLAKQYKCMSISANTIFQLHIRLLGFTEEEIGWRTDNRFLDSDIVDTNDVSNDVLKYCNQYEKLSNTDSNLIINIANFIIQMIIISPFNRYNEMIICLIFRLLLYKAGYGKLSNCNLEKIILDEKEEITRVINKFIKTKGENYHEWISIFGSILIKFFDNCTIDSSDSIKNVVKRMGKKFTDYEVHKHCSDYSIGKIRETLNAMLSSGEISRIDDGKNVFWSRTTKFNDGKDNICRGDKTKIVIDAINSMKGLFCFSDIHSTCRNISSITIRKVLESEKKQGKIVCFKKGRSSTWQRVKF